MKARMWFLFFWGFSVAIQGCGGDSPTASDEPPLPAAIPNALVLDNLPLIQNLERSRRSDTILSYITGSGLQLNGRVLDGDSWEFAFVKRDPITVYGWFVFSDGHIDEIPGHTPAGPPLSPNDITTHIKINSDRAITIGRKNGGNAYINKYPNTYVQMRYTFIYGFPTCTMRFEQRGAPCPVVITIHSETGEVLQKDLQCIE